MVSTTNKDINNSEPDAKRIRHDTVARPEKSSKFPTIQNRSEASLSRFSCRNQDEQKLGKLNKEHLDGSKTSGRKHDKSDSGDENLSKQDQCP